MKNSTLLNILLFLVITVVCSCQSDENEPAPMVKAGFTQNLEITERYEVIRFTNTSLNAERYHWDFGNGITSTKKNPEINFYDPGTYKVRLIAYDKFNGASFAYDTVKVGRKHITKIEVERLDPISHAGYTWDPQDGPDLYMRIAPKNSPDWIYSPVHYNATTFPVSWEYTPNVVMAEAEHWVFELYDEDLPFPAQEIAGLVLHTSSNTTKNTAGDKGYIVHEQREARFVIHFDVK